jgi:hypothetical protein
MEQHHDWTMSSAAEDDKTSFHAPWPEPAAHEFGAAEEALPDEATPPEEPTPVGFDEAFDLLDRQTEQLRTLRGRLQSICEYSAERDRAMRRIEQELAAARAESEHDRRVAAGLRAELEKQDQLLRSVRETVSGLAHTLDAVNTSWNSSQAA